MRSTVFVAMENSLTRSCLYCLQQQQWRRPAIVCAFVLVTWIAATVDGYPSQPLPPLAEGPWRSLARERRAPEDDTEMSGEGEGEGTGSGIGSGVLPISCTRSAEVDPYSLVAERLTSLASDCGFISSTTVFSARENGAMTDLFSLPESNKAALFADYFLSNQSYHIMVEAPCSPNCKDLELHLQLTVSPYLSRLLPYGDLLGDSFMSSVDDSAVPVTAYQAIPAFGNCFSQIYVRNTCK